MFGIIDGIVVDETDDFELWETELARAEADAAAIPALKYFKVMVGVRVDKNGIASDIEISEDGPFHNEEIMQVLTPALQKRLEESIADYAKRRKPVLDDGSIPKFLKLQAD